MDTDTNPQPGADAGKPQSQGGSWVLTTATILILLGAFSTIVMPSTSGHGAEGARRTKAKAEMTGFSNALDNFRSLCGRYPTTEEGLAALVTRPAGIPEAKWERQLGKVDEVLRDPWGHPYLYGCPGVHHPDSYDLYSAGHDGRPDTDDDIDSR